MPKGKQVLVRIGEKEVGFAAALRVMNPELREMVLQRLAAVSALYGLRGPLPQEIVDVYLEVHREKFGTDLKVDV